MSKAIITVENLSKRYRLGQIGMTTLRESAQRFFHSVKRWRPAQFAITRELIAGSSPTEQRAANDRNPDEFWALSDVSFEIQPGEVFGIIGRNGAGKSTLLKILSRITEPTSGRAVIRGRVASLLEVGTGFHPELSGRENIFLNGAILGMKKAEIARKFDEIVDFAEVEKFIDTPVKHYSSGMYVRLAFAVAAHLEPEILVIDEVLAVGDAGFQSKCLGKMGSVAGEGRTVLFVSHNMSAIKNLCARAILLDRGTVAFEGSAIDATNQYLGKYLRCSSCIDLSGFQSKYGHGELQVVSIELLNGVEGGFCIPWDRPVKLRMVAKVNRDLRSVSFAVGFCTLDQTPLFTSRSVDVDYPQMTLKAGDIKTMEVTITHPLRAGVYLIVIGVASGNYSYYFNDHAAQLEILPIGDKPYADKNVGLMNCDANWNLI